MTQREVAQEIRKFDKTYTVSTLMRKYKKDELQAQLELLKKKRVAKSKPRKTAIIFQDNPKTDYVDATNYKTKYREALKGLEELRYQNRTLEKDLEVLSEIIKSNSIVAKIKRFFGITK